MSAVNDLKQGKEALIYFHNASLKFPENYSQSFEALLSHLQDSSHGLLVENLGYAINLSEMSDSQVRRAMESLASRGEGKLPSSWNAFITALNSTSGEINFVDAVRETASGTASDIGAGFQEVGAVASDTLKSIGSLLPALPFVVFAGLAYFVFLKSKKLGSA